MRDYIVTSLISFKKEHKRPYRLGILNLGGTIICLKNKKGLLAPIQKISLVHKIFTDILGFGELMQHDLLQMDILFNKPIDSSQLKDSDREKLLPFLQKSYVQYDGFMVVHGTDTAALTARFLHLTLPYIDPVAFYKTGTRIPNWVKPIVIVSSQEPAAKVEDGKYVPFEGSDAHMIVPTALAALTHRSFGEVGALAGTQYVFRGTSTKKGSESHFDFLGLACERNLGGLQPAVEFHG